MAFLLFLDFFFEADFFLVWPCFLVGEFVGAAAGADAGGVTGSAIGVGRGMEELSGDCFFSNAELELRERLIRPEESWEKPAMESEPQSVRTRSDVNIFFMHQACITSRRNQA